MPNDLHIYNVHIPRELFVAAKAKAQAEGIPIRAIILRALIAYLKEGQLQP